MVKRTSRDKIKIKVRATVWFRIRLGVLPTTSHSIPRLGLTMGSRSRVRCGSEFRVLLHYSADGPD